MPFAAAPPSRRIVIAGGGIAGLTAAIAFAAKGLPVRLFERVANLQEVGAGLQLSPNATRILSRLGVPDYLRAASIRPEAVLLHRASDLRQIARVPLGAQATARWKSPYLVVHRADLHAALFAVASKMPQIEIVTGATVSDAALHARGVSVAVDGEGPSREIDALLLVAADGVWSGLRKLVGGDGASSFSGRIAWRATVRADGEAVALLADHLPRDCVSAFLHPRAHLVAYPVRGGSSINLAAFTHGAAQGASWSQSSEARPLTDALGGAAQPLLDFLGAIGSWTVWPIHTVDPRSAWINPGGAVLIGDAAHAMTPFAAQGAAAAIEDAYVLAATVAEQLDDIGAALRRYERIRRPRVAAVARRGAFNAFTWHAAGPIALGRDLVLGLLPSTKLAADLDWLYGWDADAELAKVPPLKADR
jgi:salicylate hydroxylase